MVLLYVRKVELGSEEKGTAERADGVAVEVSVARVKGTTVQELRTAVAEKTKLKPEDLCIMYGGRILRAGGTLDQYSIKDGCTLHLLPKRRKENLITLPISPEGMSVIFIDPKVQMEMAAFISDPALVTKMIPMGDQSRVEEILKDAELMKKLSDMARISHYIHHNSYIFLVMEALLKLHRHKYRILQTEETAAVQASLFQQLGQGIGLGPEEIAEGQRHAERLATAQEQMFERTQALHSQQRAQHPHPQSSHPTPPSSHHTPPSSHHPHSHTRTSTSTSSTSTSMQPHTGTLSNGGATGFSQSSNITPSDLATALASIGTEHSSSSSSSSGTSSSHPPSIPPSSQPTSLQTPNLNFDASSAPPSLQLPTEQTSTAPLPHSVPHPPPPPVHRSMSDSGEASVRMEVSTSSSSLQSALTNALSNIQTQPPSRSHSDQPSLHDYYQPHLEQLHAMGITSNDAECLHALDAAQGDLQTALEILMGPGN